jgi:putative membrane protein
VLIASLLIIFIAVLHLYILILQTALWTKPAGRRAFGLTEDFARASKVLAANQGLYNGFLAAGLIFGLMQGEAGRIFAIFFLTCIFVAGIFGAMTASRKILFIQAVPAALALAAVYAGI